MRRSRLARYVLSLVLALAAAPADLCAQPVFVDGGALGDYDPTLRSQTPMTIGATAGVGVFMTPRMSVRLELDFPRWHPSHHSGSGRVGQRLEAFSTRESARAPSISVLAAGHIRPRSRVDVALLAGATSAARAWRQHGVTEFFDLNGTLIDRRESSTTGGTHRWLALTFGTDVTVPLTARLAVVPQVRIHSYLYSEHTSLVFVRPRVSLRWQF
jgi:hypothetical protein